MLLRVPNSMELQLPSAEASVRMFCLDDRYSTTLDLEQVKEQVRREADERREEEGMRREITFLVFFFFFPLYLLRQARE